MKKITTILLMLLAFTIQAQVDLLLTEDTTIPYSENYRIVRTNGYNLTVEGSLNVSSFILLNKGNQADGGSIYATDDIIVSGNVFFLNDNGYIKSDTGVSIGDDITGTGTIYYCTFFQHGFTNDASYFVQDCTLSIEEYEYDFFKEANLLGRFNILGQKEGNILNGIYIAYYESLDGIVGKRKELWKDGIMISSAVISKNIMKR